MAIDVTLTAFSPTPNRLTDSPDIFAQKGVVSLAEQANLVTELNVWKGQVNQTAETINQAEQTATTKAAQAADSQTAAAQSEQNALDYRNGALEAREAAALSAQSAQDDADRSMISRLYADETPDVQVESGTYSAKHWAAKAAEQVQSGITAITRQKMNFFDLNLMEKI